MINTIRTDNPIPAAATQKHIEKKLTKEVPKGESKKTSEAVVYEKAPVETFTTYDAKKIQELKAQVDAKFESLRNVVRQLVENQGMKYEAFLEKLDKKEEVMIPIDEETRAAAQAEIAEDGFWGVDNTAERIFDFAKTISGGDTSKKELLLSAIEEGFAKAKEAFGGELPEISQKTYDKVMALFDEWGKSEETETPSETPEV